MVLAAVSAGGLAGCRVVKRPAPPYPAVEWQGAAPSGALEADPWVQATRKFLEAEAVARNINDFSISGVGPHGQQGRAKPCCEAGIR